MDILAKITTVEKLTAELEPRRRAGQKIVFTNGCFDLLHVGHVRYLAAARSWGDVLVVGLNSDESVRLIKGEKRPLVEQHQRAEVLASLWCVDYVVLFNEPDPLNLIRALEPDLLVKGGDWPEDAIVGADFVKSRGGSVQRIPLVPGACTSGIIQTIVNRYAKD
jgi:D-beta-D-heptose 7-phosphate kinase/D-beta-D-heptose 1-phosphate adenosyltransferase